MYCAQKQYSDTDYKKIVVETSKRDRVLSTAMSKKEHPWKISTFAT